MADLAPEHLDGFYENRSHLQSSVTELGNLKRLLARAEGLSDAMAGKGHCCVSRSGVAETDPVTPSRATSVFAGFRFPLR